MLDLQFYYHPESTFNNVGGSSIVQALEFTMSKWSQGIRYEWAVQWQNVGTGAPQWRYWGQPDPQNPKLDWVNLGIPGEISGKTWHHLILEGEILAGQVHYRRFTLDEQMHPLDITVVPTQEAGVPDKLAVAVQLDGNDWNGTGSLSPYEMFIDQVTLYSMNWSDEFVGSSLKTNNWTCEVGGEGWGNNELQYYTSCPNASVANGELKISAKKEGGHPCWYGPCECTSARLSTERKKVFQYGKIEARMKLPLGQGLWPAFWMLGSSYSKVPWPACGEMDVMEHINNEAKVYGTVHWDNGSDPHPSYGCPSSNKIPSLDVTQYHVYDIEWNPSYIRWHVDGIQYCEFNIKNSPNSTEEFQKPFFILLNLAVGGDWPGSPDASTTFPASMNVDYVRVYQPVSTVKTVFKSVDSQDGWTLESSENSNTGGTMNSTATTLYLGNNVQKKQYRSVLSFPTKSLPDTAIINKVTLRVKKQGILGGSPINTFQGFLVDVTKGFFSKSPALEIIDFQAVGSKSYGPFKPALSNGWYIFDLTASKDYINKLASNGGVTQIRLRFKLDDNNNNIANLLSLYSGDAPAFRPQLIIEYHVP